MPVFGTEGHDSNFEWIVLLSGHVEVRGMTLLRYNSAIEMDIAIEHVSHASCVSASRAITGVAFMTLDVHEFLYVALSNRTNPALVSTCHLSENLTLASIH